MYGILAQVVILALVAWFLLAPEHSGRSRLLVAGSYALTLIARYLLPQFALAVLLSQIVLGIALIFVHRWEHASQPIL